MPGAAQTIAEAFAFAAHAHAFQRRDDMGDAYVTHLAEVAESCAHHEPFDLVLVVSAILHDTLEDTDVNEEQIRQRFGDAIAETVLDVTDPPGLKGKARRERQVSHTASASSRAKLIKIADKTSNVAELLGRPGGIGAARKPGRYLDWAERVVDVCRGSDARMEAAFDQMLARARSELRQTKLGKA